jgi:hypothetical protein
LGLGVDDTVSPRVAQKVVHSGAFSASFTEASRQLVNLSDLSVSAERIRRACGHVGNDRIEEQRQLQEAFLAKTLPEQRCGKPADVEAPEIACVMADGGRYQVLDRRHRVAGKRSARKGEHWKESRVGLLASMSGKQYDDDPHPQLPTALRYGAVAEKLSDIGKTGAKLDLPEASGVAETAVKGAATNDPDEFPGPTLERRKVVASGQSWEDFGNLLASQAWYQGFGASGRKVFVSDGSATIEKLQRTRFPDYTSVLDILHALSYSLAAARAIHHHEAAAQRQYDRWAEQIWQGRVGEVIDALKAHGHRIGEPPPDASSDDPREVVRTSRVYYENHAQRMNYPQYRCQGFPLTSSLMESTVKQVSRRVKGSEKYWSVGGGEAMLRLRADYLSDDDPMGAYWTRRSRHATGMRTYRRPTPATTA